MAERVGVLHTVSRNPHEDGLFQCNSHTGCDLAFSDAVVGFRLFASVFGFCERDDTRNVTRCDHLLSSSCQTIYRYGHRRRRRDLRMCALVPTNSVRCSPGLWKAMNPCGSTDLKTT